MDERRRTPRANCRLRCVVRQGRKNIRARVVDISEGGLCIFSPVWIASKSRIEIGIHVAGFPDSLVIAEVWHIRRQKVRDSSRKMWVVGVALEEPDDAYLELLAAAGGATTVGKDPPATEIDAGAALDSNAPASGAAEVAPEDAIEPRVFRVRVKAKSGPRTRLLTLTADSAEEAEAMVGRDLESQWTVVEVRAA